MATHDKLVVDKFPARTLVCSEGKLIESTNQGELLDFRSFIE
jgi:ABC-type ATPase involved in cell division